MMRCGSSFGVALGVMAAALSVAGCDVGTRETRTLNRSVELEDARAVDVELKMSTGELNVTGGSSRLLDASFRFNVPSSEPLLDYQRSNQRGTLRIAQPDMGMSLGHVENRWDLRFNNTVATDLTARLGAGEAVMALGTLDLRHVQIDVGAGELHLDLRGTPKQSYDVQIKGGVGTAQIRLPRSVAIVATATGGLGNVRVTGLEKRGDRWYNATRESDRVAIHLDVKGGVGEIVISAE